MSLNVGDRVIAAKNIGGIMRDSVEKGIPGVVTKSGWGEIRVLFTKEGWLGKKHTEISVSKDEITY